MAKEFYRSHVTFFLLVGGVAGGFMRSQDHLALATLFVSSPLLLAIPVFCWMAYTMLVCRFNAQHMALGRQEFIYSLVLVSSVQKWAIIVLVVITELAPMLLYSILLMYSAIQTSKWTSIILLLIALVLLSLVASFSLHQQLFGKREPGFLQRFSIKLHFTKPYFLFFIGWTAKRDLLQFVLTKLFTILLLLACGYVYTTDTFDTRLLLLGIAIVASLHGHFVWQMHHFDNYNMSFVRNMPIPLWHRQVTVLLTTLVLTMPEIAIMLSRYTRLVDAGTVLLLCAFLLSVPLLLYGFLFTRERKQDELVPVTFFLGIVYVIFILYEIHPLVLTAANVLMGTLFFYARYYSFEYTAGKKQEANSKL